MLIALDARRQLSIVGTLYAEEFCNRMHEDFAWIGRGLNLMDYAITSPHTLQIQLASFFLQIIPVICLPGGVVSMIEFRSKLKLTFESSKSFSCNCHQDRNFVT